MTQRCIAGGTWLRTVSPKSRSSAPSPRGTTRPPKASAPTSTLSPPWSPHGKCQRTLVAAFDGGRITTDGGVLLLGAVERQVGLATRLAQLSADPRNPALVTHSVDDILRARILAIACGYEDADDLDHLRTD